MVSGSTPLQAIAQFIKIPALANAALGSGIGVGICYATIAHAALFAHLAGAAVI